MNSCGKSFHIDSKAECIFDSLPGSQHRAPHNDNPMQWNLANAVVTGFSNETSAFLLDPVLFILKSVHLSSNSYYYCMQPNISVKCAGYVALILLRKQCKFGEKKLLQFHRDIEEFFLRYYRTLPVNKFWWTILRTSRGFCWRSTVLRGTRLILTRRRRTTTICRRLTDRICVSGRARWWRSYVKPGTKPLHLSRSWSAQCPTDTRTVDLWQTRTCNIYQSIIVCSMHCIAALDRIQNQTACPVSGLRCPMSGQCVNNSTSNGHNSATRHPIDFVFGFRLGFLARTY